MINPPVAPQRSWKMGCLVIGVFLMLLSGYGYLVVSRASDTPDVSPRKGPGEGELLEAETYIRSYRGQEAFGNSPEAVAFAQDYARLLKEIRDASFSKGKTGAVMITEGHFLTYCYAKEDSVAVLVHVPELRRFAEEAKVQLSEQAWILASMTASAKFPKARKLALGVKGLINYAALYSGDIDPKMPMKGLRYRYPVDSTDPLRPFFTASIKAVPLKAVPLKLESQKAAPLVTQ